jgi:hypothetical protein
MSIDWNGVKKVLKAECMICNWYERVGMKNVCSDCPFCYNSAPKKGQPSRIGLSAKVFKPLGLTNKQISNWGRHHLFMYLFHEELNCQPPDLPDKDRYGNIVDKQKDKYSINHGNGLHYDNREGNLGWTLPKEHIILDKANLSRKKAIKEDAKKLGKKYGLR